MDAREYTFVAESAAEAVQKIRKELGPDATVVQVRSVAPRGIQKIWRKARVEIIARAAAPAEAPAAEDPIVLLREMREELNAIRSQLAVGQQAPLPAVDSLPAPQAPRFSDSPWKTIPLLESSGFLPMTIQRLFDRVQHRHGALPPENLGAEMEWVSETLREIWESKKRQTPAQSRHVFVGPSGTGKTTILCKWLAHEVLLGSRPARVWQLHGQTANTSEILSVHCEILGVPLEKTWKEPGSGSEMQFIDLPGVQASQASSISELKEQLRRLGPADVHLVLNAAYDTSLLLQQVRAFGPLPVTDLVFTHLDEDKRWGKIWNFVVGTNFSVGFIGSGQNVPGDFHAASAELLLNRNFPRKQAVI